MLLDGQTGRYFWLWLEVTGGGTLENLRVYVPGDNFFRTFQRAYQIDDAFLRRYLSIFYTMYQDLQKETDSIPEPASDHFPGGVRRPGYVYIFGFKWPDAAKCAGKLG